MQNKGHKSNLGNFGTILFWGIYLLVGVAAWWHTYQIFAVKDPPFIAGASALAVEGVLAFTLYLIGRTMGDQRKTGMIGVMLFALISAAAQVASRNIGQVGFEWVEYITAYLLPITVTGSIVLLGFIKYFDRDGNGIPDFMENRNRQSQGNQPQNQFRQRPEPLSQGQRGAPTYDPALTMRLAQEEVVRRKLSDDDELDGIVRNPRRRNPHEVPPFMANRGNGSGIHATEAPASPKLNPSQQRSEQR